MVAVCHHVALTAIGASQHADSDCALSFLARAMEGITAIA